MKVVIIEDEFLVADELESIIVSDKNIQVIKKLSNISEALEYFNYQAEIDLIFSDIQLSDGLSFEIFKRLELNVPIIFCTAFDHYALEAFKSNGVDYILKPFDKETILKSLDKFTQLTKNEPSQENQKIEQLLLSLSQTKQEPKKSLLMYKGDKIFPIKIENIAVAEYDNSIIYIHTFDGNKYTCDQSLDSIESSLNEEFYRVNRQSIIHKRNIEHVSKYFARKLLIKPLIESKNELIVSKAKASDFLTWLQK